MRWLTCLRCSRILRQMVPVGGPPGQGSSLAWRVKQCQEISKNASSRMIVFFPIGNQYLITVIEQFHRCQCFISMTWFKTNSTITLLPPFPMKLPLSCVHLGSGSPPPSGPMQMGPPPVYWPQARRENAVRRILRTKESFQTIAPDQMHVCTICTYPSWN